MRSITWIGLLLEASAIGICEEDEGKAGLSNNGSGNTTTDSSATYR